MKTILNYLKNSNLVIVIRLNPISWNLIPSCRNVKNQEWGQPALQLVSEWLFLKISIYIDDGSW